MFPFTIFYCGKAVIPEKKEKEEDSGLSEYGVGDLVRAQRGEIVFMQLPDHLPVPLAAKSEGDAASSPQLISLSRLQVQKLSTFERWGGGRGGDRDDSPNLGIPTLAGQGKDLPGFEQDWLKKRQLPAFRFLKLFFFPSDPGNVSSKRRRNFHL
jgi:hypothetical protein